MKLPNICILGKYCYPCTLKYYRNTEKVLYTNLVLFMFTCIVLKPLTSEISILMFSCLDCQEATHWTAMPEVPGSIPFLTRIFMFCCWWFFFASWCWPKNNISHEMFPFLSFGKHNILQCLTNKPIELLKWRLMLRQMRESPLRHNACAPCQ